MANGASVSVVYIAVGSNIDAERNVPAALRRLRDVVAVTGVSTVYRTMPVGRPEQPCFVNGVVRAVTEREPRALKFSVLRPIELTMGRVRGADRHAPRTIDLDIAVYADRVIDEPGLLVPDPAILQRPFVAVPLLELAPDLVVPGTGLRLADQPVVRQVGGLEPLPELTRLLREIARR